MTYKLFFCINNCSDIWVKIKKLTNHKKYNTIPDNIFYDNNIFSKCEIKMSFSTCFSLIATNLQVEYFPKVNSENILSHDRYLKNPLQNKFVLHLYLLMIF